MAIYTLRFDHQHYAGDMNAMRNDNHLTAARNEGGRKVIHNDTVHDVRIGGDQHHVLKLKGSNLYILGWTNPHGTFWFEDDKPQGANGTELNCKGSYQTGIGI